MSEDNRSRIIIIGAMSESAQEAIKMALNSYYQPLPIPENVKVVVCTGNAGCPGEVIHEDISRLKMEGEFLVERMSEIPYLASETNTELMSTTKYYDRRYLPRFNNSKNKRRK